MSDVVVVTGTSTDVGKTVVTAALAATLEGRVLVVKPVQTGIGDGTPGDADTVASLAGVDVLTFTTLDPPLAPDTAARLAGVELPTVSAHASQVRSVMDGYDVVIVEGAGGLLVRLDTDGGTLLDLMCDLATTHEVDVVVVCSAGLGTLNHAELTVGAIRARGLEPAGLVVGSWPLEPGLAERCNFDDLPRVTGVPLLACLPAGAGSMTLDDFRAAAPAWFSQDV